MPCKFASTFVYFIVSLLLALILPPIHTQNAPRYYLDAHNSARAKVGVGPMTWNETLATYAENYAYTRVADCTRESSGGPYGENLANGTESSISGTDIINIWIAEKANYDSSSNVCVGLRSCKNYTQVVWQKSLRLGCAKVRCSEGGYFFSCNYDPPGNLIGQRPFEINESSAPTPNSNYLPPFISPSPAAKPPNFDSVPGSKPISNYTEDSRNEIGLVVGLIAGASALIILGLVFVWFFLRWKRKQKESYPVFDVSFGAEFENGTGPRKFSYRELASATNNFCEEAKLGEGGFGAVYKGFLKDLNTFVAVKKVSLVPWVWELYGNKRLVDAVDKKLGMNFDIKQMECLMIVGFWCAHPARNLRPSIRQAIQGLNFELPLPNLPSKMPVPNYDVSSSSAPAPTTMSGESWLSLTVPRIQSSNTLFDSGQSSCTSSLEVCSPKDGPNQGKVRPVIEEIATIIHQKEEENCLKDDGDEVDVCFSSNSVGTREEMVQATVAIEKDHEEMHATSFGLDVGIYTLKLGDLVAISWLPLTQHIKTSLSPFVSGRPRGDLIPDCILGVNVTVAMVTPLNGDHNKWRKCPVST
ncbi:hypothetical protein Q3G72_021591 [Acer saccharum]|nr:hypothetical protein Q3G72_021591 [Acer saccharum]